MPTNENFIRNIRWLPPDAQEELRTRSPETHETNLFNHDPVGVSQGALGDLQGLLTNAFKTTQRPGLEAAMQLLAERGKIDDRATDLGRRDIESKRQMLQQDIAQQAGQGGLAGAFSANRALASQGNLAAEDATARFEEDQAFAQDLRRRQDISGIFSALTGPGHTLLGAKRPGIEKGPSDLQSGLQLAGNLFGTYNQYRSMKGQ